ncbi:retropepsin-like aspartic protease [Paraglaciecola sp. 25GB23A]|uniref:retropepsin-like aspartic protease n=1 Tax=Paraglaciecola sp. 25GB23A TaxID=3156068 RepID=UPI0032AFA8CD
MTRQSSIVFLLTLSVLLNVFLLVQLLSRTDESEVNKPEAESMSSNQLGFSQTSSSTTLNAQLNPSTSQQSPEQLPRLKRDELLAQGKQWLVAANYPELELFLRDYLQQHPLDMDFLLLEAELIVHTQLLSDAIAHYYSLKKLPMNAVQEQLVNTQINTLSAQTITQLQKAYSWDTLAIFVEPLLQLEPENRDYILALAEAYAQQQQINLMENTLAALAYDDPSAMRLRQLTLITQTKEKSSDAESPDIPFKEPVSATAIKLQQMGDQYVVHGQLSGNNVALLIDTGASITAVSNTYFQNLANRFKINFIGRFNVNTAAGKVLAPMYQFAELKLNHAIVYDISIIVLPMRNMDNVNGLLGMNFLREFDFKIDQRQAMLFLKP